MVIPVSPSLACTLTPLQPSPRPLICPVCFRFSETSEVRLSRHVDVCLGVGSADGASVKAMISAHPTEKRTKKVFPTPKAETGSAVSGERSAQVAASKGSAPAVETYSCPVCHRELSLTVIELNQHIDHCLSKSAIRDAVRETQQAPAPKKRRTAGGGGLDAFLNKRLHTSGKQ